MSVLTYTSNKVHNDLYTKIQGSIAVNGCQVGLAQKDIILLSNISFIVYKAGKRTRVINTDHIGFTLSEDTYSLIIIMQRSRWQSFNKDKTGKHLKLN